MHWRGLRVQHPLGELRPSILQLLSIGEAGGGL